KSVWDRQANDVFLIGPQHFDLSIPEVRDKLTEISGMRDVIAKDLWDSQQSAHAQVIDLQTGKESARQVGALLLTASLSTAVNAVKGLTREEMVECLASPLREPSEFLTAFEELEKSAWYPHHTPEGRYYFDRQENLTKLLQSLAHDAPENQVDDLMRHRLTAMFKPTRKSSYDDVLPLPRIEDVADRVCRGRVLLIVSPDAKIPPEEVQKFFEGLSQKNNLGVILTVGQGNQVVGLNVGEVPVQAAFLESILKSVLDLEKFTPDTPITMSFRKAHFASGHDLRQFADKLGIELQTGDVEQ